MSEVIKPQSVFAYTQPSFKCQPFLQELLFKKRFKMLTHNRGLKPSMHNVSRPKGSFQKLDPKADLHRQWHSSSCLPAGGIPPKEQDLACLCWASPGSCWSWSPAGPGPSGRQHSRQVYQPPFQLASGGKLGKGVPCLIAQPQNHRAVEQHRKFMYSLHVYKLFPLLPTHSVVTFTNSETSAGEWAFLAPKERTEL